MAILGCVIHMCLCLLIERNGHTFEDDLGRIVLMRKKIIVLIVFAIVISIAGVSASAAREISVDINGISVQFADQPPILVDGRVLVPLRAVFEHEQIGAEVRWNQDTRTATVIGKDTSVALQVGNPRMSVRDRNTGVDSFVELDVPPGIYNERTLLPIRAVLEAFGCTLIWDGKNQSVQITTPDFSQPPETPSNATSSQPPETPSNATSSPLPPPPSTETQSPPPSTASMSNFKKTRTYTPGMFRDILKENELYVITAYEYDVMDGMTPTAFAPRRSMSIAEAIVYADRIHSIYMTGTVNLVNGVPWYQSYVDYAVANGIIASNAFSDFNQVANRAQIAYIYSHALHVTEYPSLNTVNSLPDVDGNTPYVSGIVLLYRAGIVVGDAETGAFRPYDEVTRAEVAEIISRLILPGTRGRGKTFG